MLDLMRNLMPFSIGSVIKKLNHIHFQISDKHNCPFPKPEAFWVSKYAYERRYIRIHDDGRSEGGLSRFVSSLVDFSFVRSIVAHKYICILSKPNIRELKNAGVLAQMAIMVLLLSS